MTEAHKRAAKNYLLKHPERRKATIAKYYAKNREKERARLLKWQAENPERYGDWKRQYKRKRYAQGLDTPQAWQKKNPGKVRVYKSNVRAKRESVQGQLSVGLAERLLILQRGRCAACNCKLVKYHVDHIVSLAKGGLNVDENIQLLCPFCNQSKNARDPIEFMQSRGKLL